MSGEKIVMVVDKHLPKGLAANSAAVLGITLGSLKPQIIGADCFDKDGIKHLGITKVSIPVLAADQQEIKEIYRQTNDLEHVELIDFSMVAQGCRDYSDYGNKMLAVENDDLKYSGLCLIGPPKQISRLTGALPLIR